MKIAKDIVSDLLRRQKIMADFGELALRSNDLDEILTESCRLVGEALGTDLAKVVELQSDGETLLVRAGVGWNADVVGTATIKASENTSEGHALKTGEPMISADIATETRFVYAPFLIENGVKAVANVPIIGGLGKAPFGILQVDSREPREFSESDTAFLSGYANLIAAAVDRLSALREFRHLSRRNAMGTMAEALAHELNQPLAVISNYADGCTAALKESGFESPELTQGLQAIAKASIRAGNVIKGLRKMTRNRVTVTERFPIQAALHDAAELVRVGGCGGVKIDCKSSKRAWVDADRTEIEQVIINLIKNGCEAIQEDSQGSVTASVRVKSGQVRLTVRDEGQGIEKARILSLFDSAKSSKPEGMGIGLSISRTIIEQHGGKLELDNTSSGGSSFSVWLPESRATVDLAA